MNYRNEIQNIINSLSQDKGVNPKWRNKAVARLEDADLYLLKAGLDTGQAQASLDQTAPTDDSLCVCRKDQNGRLVALRRSCPIHGQEAASRIAEKQNSSTGTGAINS